MADATHNKYLYDFIQFLFNYIRTSLAFELSGISKDHRTAGKDLRGYEENYKAIRLGDLDKAWRKAWFISLAFSGRLGLGSLKRKAGEWK